MQQLIDYPENTKLQLYNCYITRVLLTIILLYSSNYIKHHSKKIVLLGGRDRLKKGREPIMKIKTKKRKRDEKEEDRKSTHIATES